MLREEVGPRPRRRQVDLSRPFEQQIGVSHKRRDLCRITRDLPLARQAAKASLEPLAVVPPVLVRSVVPHLLHLAIINLRFVSVRGPARRAYTGTNRAPRLPRGTARGTRTGSTRLSPFSWNRERTRNRGVGGSSSWTETSRHAGSSI